MFLLKTEADLISMLVEFDGTEYISQLYSQYERIIG